MRHVLITGGSKGIGQMVTESFLKNGYSVTINYRSDEQAVAVLKEKWKNYSERVQFVKGDMTKKNDITHLFNQAMTRFNRIDCLVNNAGPFVFERKKLIDHTDEEWSEMINGNLSSVFHLVKKVVPVMRTQGHGRIITYGFQDAGSAPGWLSHGAFAAGKTGLVSLTRTLAMEEAEHGITVNMVCPGVIHSDMKQTTIKEAKKVSAKMSPLGRSVTGEDIANTILFLCQEETEMVTGAIMDMTATVDVINRFRPTFGMDE